MREKACFIGLGSNQGEREDYLKQALDGLDHLPETRLAEVSSFYETEPVDCEGPWFLNAVARLHTLLSPERLLQDCLTIERDLGRIRNNSPNTARTLDLDILFYESLVLNLPNLCIPHPRLHERSFVLTPLSEIAGEFEHPILKQSVSEMLSHLKVQQFRAQKSRAQQQVKRLTTHSSLRSTLNP